MNAVSAPKSAIVVNILENTYTCPKITMGHIIDIESSKVQFSNGSYGLLARSGVFGARVAMEITEMAACFTTLFPKMKEDLRVDSIFDLDIDATLLLLKEYKSKVLPTYSELIAMFQDKEENK